MGLLTLEVLQGLFHLSSGLLGNLDDVFGIPQVAGPPRHWVAVNGPKSFVHFLNAVQACAESKCVEDVVRDRRAVASRLLLRRSGTGERSWCETLAAAAY